MKYNPQIVLKWFAAHGLHPVPEHKFHPSRKWRFDFAFPDDKIALEVEGGIHTGGRHTRGAGFKADMEKYNNATLLGWRVFRVVPTELCMQDTVEMIKGAMGYQFRRDYDRASN
jgi:very-short-patch-repair endonuclease